MDEKKSFGDSCASAIKEYGGLARVAVNDPNSAMYRQYPAAEALAEQWGKEVPALRAEVARLRGLLRQAQPILRYVHESSVTHGPEANSLGLRIRGELNNEA